MAELNFEMRTDLAPIRSITLDANFDELGAKLTELMAPYKTMVVTEDAIPAAKKDRAEIRRIASRIDEERRTVKKIYSEPVKVFEEKCKKLTAILDEAAQNIDSQIKEVEERNRNAKLETLHKYFDKTVNDMAEYLSWEDVFDKRWGNSTFTVENAMAEIVAKVLGCRNDVSAIMELKSPFEVELLSMYQTTHDISACIRHNTALGLRRKAYLERKAASDERNEQPCDNAETPQKSNSVEKTAESGETTSAHELSIAFRAYGSKETLLNLANYMRENGIRFERA